MEVGGESVEPAKVDDDGSVPEETSNSSPDLDGKSQITVARLSPEELVAKAIAPVKSEFLRPPPVRADATSAPNQNESVHEHKSAPLLKEKKSKRQLKRERRQELKSAVHLCPEVAKSGKVSSCAYGDKCRFSHDMEAFKTLKPADLDGKCPFLEINEGPCPYGLACRFAGTHKDDDNDAADSSNGTWNLKRHSSEVNSLNKDVQKLLWKNKMKFTKADNSLKLLGLVGKEKKMVGKNNNDEFVANGTNVVVDSVNAEATAVDSSNEMECCSKELAEDKLDDADEAIECRPVKKSKSSSDEVTSSSEIANGAASLEKQIEKNSEQNKLYPNTDYAAMETDESLKSHLREKKIIDFRDKLYLAPLTTVGNLPFRRVCKFLGADVTCGEMAMCTNLLQGQASEWALLRRHSSEDLFGVQICGAYPDTVAKTVELIEKECSVDFIDINMGCPIDIVVNKGAGSALLTKPMRMKNVIQAASGTVAIPITVKVRTAYFEGRNRVDSLIEDIGKWGATAITIHGRSRQQRYSKLADWDYIYRCVEKAPHSLQVLGNGDVFSYLDWNKHKTDCPKLSACMVARGALIKPWIFTEIKEQRHWDISSGERLNFLKDYVKFGLQHWGSDSKGVETTRHFLLEWLSYTCRYVPVGLLDVIPQRINWRPPSYYGRDDLETLMASDSAADWIRISEMVLGKVPDGFTFAPKHKSNAYDRAENG